MHNMTCTVQLLQKSVHISLTAQGNYFIILCQTLSCSQTELILRTFTVRTLKVIN